MQRWHRPYVYLTILSISQLVAFPIALLLFLAFGISPFLGRGGYVGLPFAIAGLISLGANLTGAILILLKKTSGLYFDAIGLAIWMFFAWFFGFVYLGFPLVGVPIMIAELILGWRGIRQVARKVSIRNLLINKIFLVFAASIIVATSVAGVFLAYGGIQGPFCPPETNPSIYCAFNYPRSYASYQEVTVDGNLVATKYTISPLLTRDYYDNDPYKAWLGYLTISISDGNGNVLTGNVASRGEAQEKLINHVMSLEPGDRVTLKGYVATVPDPNCPPEHLSSSGCSDFIGTMGIKSVDGIDTSKAVLPWTVPDKQKPKWYLGANLSDSMVFDYNITYSQASISPLDASEQHKKIEYANTNFIASIGFDNSTGTANLLPFDMTINDLGDEGAQNLHYNCSYNFDANDVSCSPVQLQSRYLKPLAKTVFYLGQFANSTSPKPLLPLWDVWAKDYDYTPTSKQDFETNKHRIMVLYDKEISVPSLGMVNATAIGWDNAQWFVVKEVPLPLRGEARQTSVYEAHYDIKFDLLQVK